MTDPKYRRASILCCVMAACIQTTGINSVNIYSTKIYETIQEENGGGGISPPVGSVLNMIAQVIACWLSPFVTYFSFRTIINRGFLALAISMTGVAVLAYLAYNTVLVFVLMLFLFFFQATLGTYSWVYLGQVACDEGLSIATGILWGCTLILSIWTNKMFEVM